MTANIPPSHLKSILIVDDNPANRKLACEFLKPFSVVTTTAANGEEAVSSCRKSQFDLILMDLHMPGLSGRQTTRAIRQQENPARTPIVALTADTVEDKKCELLLADMDDFLSKPIQENDLKDIVNRWLETPLDSTHSQDPRTVKSSSSNTQTDSRDTQTEMSSVIFSLNESLKLSKNLPDLATDMLKFLLDSLDETISGLRLELKTENMDALLEITHKFHGGCCYCGVPALRKSVKLLEQAIHNNESDIKAITTLSQCVFNEIERLKNWANEHDIDALFSDH